MSNGNTDRTSHACPICWKLTGPLHETKDFHGNFVSIACDTCHAAIQNDLETVFKAFKGYVRADESRACPLSPFINGWRSLIATVSDINNGKLPALKPRKDGARDEH